MNAVMIFLIALVGMPGMSFARCRCLHDIKPSMLKAVIPSRKAPVSDSSEIISSSERDEQEYCQVCLEQGNEDLLEPETEMEGDQEHKRGIVHRTVTRLKNYVQDLPHTLPQVPQPTDKQWLNGAAGLASVGVAALAWKARKKDPTQEIVDQIRAVETELDQANKRLGEARGRPASGNTPPTQEHTVVMPPVDQDFSHINKSLETIQGDIQALSEAVQQGQSQTHEQDAKQFSDVLEKIQGLKQGLVFLVERIREVKEAQEKTPAISPPAVTNTIPTNHSREDAAVQRVEDLWQEMNQVEDRIRGDIGSILHAIQQEGPPGGATADYIEQELDQLFSDMKKLVSNVETHQNTFIQGEVVKIFKGLQILQEALQKSHGLTEADKKFITQLHNAPRENTSIPTTSYGDMQEVKDAVAALAACEDEDKRILGTVQERVDWIKRFLEENNTSEDAKSKAEEIIDSLQRIEQQQATTSQAPASAPVGLSKDELEEILQRLKKDIVNEVAAKSPKPQPAAAPQGKEPATPTALAPVPEKKVKQPKPKASSSPKPNPQSASAAAPASPAPTSSPKVFKLTKVKENQNFLGGQKQQMKRLNQLIERVNRSFENFSYTVQEADSINRQVEQAVGELLRKSSSRTSFYKELQRIQTDNQQALNAWKRSYVTNQENNKEKGNSSKLINFIKNFKLCDQ